MLQNAILNTLLNQRAPQPADNNNAPALANTAPQGAQAPAGTNALQVLMKDFLPKFEYVELDFPVEGAVKNPEKPLGYHPHLQFRMCGDDIKEMRPDQLGVHLGMQIEKGVKMLETFGLQLDDWYVNARKGTLTYDVKFRDLPEGVSQEQALTEFADQLQQACKELRAQKKQQQGVAA